MADSDLSSTVRAVFTAVRKETIDALKSIPTICSTICRGLPREEIQSAYSEYKEIRDSILDVGKDIVSCFLEEPTRDKWQVFPPYFPAHYD
jgi:hypothetical protein